LSQEIFVIRHPALDGPSHLKEAFVYSGDEIKNKSVKNHIQKNKLNVFCLPFRKWNKNDIITKTPEAYGWSPRKYLEKNGFKCNWRINLVKGSSYSWRYDHGIPNLKNFTYWIEELLQKFNFQNKEFIIFRSFAVYPTSDFLEVYSPGTYHELKEFHREMIKSDWRLQQMDKKNKPKIIIPKLDLSDQLVVLNQLEK